MTDRKDSPDEAPSARGHAAWQEARDGVAKRNAEASKLGMERRAAAERAAETRRLKVEDAEMARFMKSRGDR